MGKIYEKDATGRSVLLKRVRTSFAESLQVASLPKKNRDPNAKPTHGSNFIIERSKPDFESDKEAIITALKAAAREFKKPENWWKTLWDDSPDKLAFKKGERFKHSETGEIFKGYEGNLVLAAKGPKGGKERPRIRDRYKKVIEDVSMINEIVYNGTYSDVIISFYGTDNGGSDRLTCSVQEIRSWQEGERLGGGGVYADADDFDDADDGDDGFAEKPSNSSSSGDFDL